MFNKAENQYREPIIQTSSKRVQDEIEQSVEFQLSIPNKYIKVQQVILMIQIQGEKNFQQIQMIKSKFTGFYSCFFYISETLKYQYFYKVNNVSEGGFRSYQFDDNLKNKVDEWNKIWIGYRFLVPEDLITYQINENDECPSVIFDSFPKIFENFQLLPMEDISEYFTVIASRNLELDEIQFIQRSNCLIIEFSFESYFLKNEQDQYEQEERIYFQNDIYGLNKQIKLLEDKFNHHQQIYSNYTNNLNTILEELTLNNSQVSNEQIQHLLTPIKIPIIPEDPAFEKCKSNLIIINNKLEDLKNNNIRIQDQYHALKIAYDQGIQQLSDYEKVSVKKNDINQHQIIKLKQELDFKKKQIENLKKEIRIIEAKRKYHEEIQQKEQKLIDLIESQKQEKQLILDTNQKIKLLEIEKLRLKTLIREKDIYVINQSDYVTTLLKQIQYYKELSK